MEQSFPLEFFLEKKGITSDAGIPLFSFLPNGSNGWSFKKNAGKSTAGELAYSVIKRAKMTVRENRAN